MKRRGKMDFKEKIINFVTYFNNRQEERDRKFKEFMNTYKWILTNIPEPIRRRFLTLSSLVTNKDYRHYSIKFTLSDYGWWLKEYSKNPFLDIAKDTTSEVQQYVLEKMTEINMEELIDSKEKLEEIIQQMNETYNFHS